MSQCQVVPPDWSLTLSILAKRKTTSNATKIPTKDPLKLLPFAKGTDCKRMRRNEKKAQH